MEERKKAYLNYLRDVKKLSQNTLMAYTKDLNDYVNYLTTHKITLKRVQKNTIFAYENYLYHNGKSNSSVARAIVSIRGFHQYFVESGYLKRNPALNVETPKQERVLPGILTLGEIELLLQQPNCTNYKGYRDKAILELLYATGIRVSELILLKFSDVDFHKGTISCTDRIIPFGAFSSEALKKYVEMSPFLSKTKLDTYLFLNTGGKQLTRQGVWKLMKKYSVQSGIPKDISPQILRHSFAAHLIENGADIKIVQELMGHTALSSTLIYAELNKNKLRDAYDKAHPRA